MSRKNLVLQLWPKMLSANKIAVFFNHQFLCTESSNLLDFFDRDNHQKKVASKTTIFGWVWPVLLSHQNAGFFDHQYLWKE